MVELQQRPHELLGVANLGDQVPVLILVVHRLVVMKLLHALDHLEMAQLSLHGHHRIVVEARAFHSDSWKSEAIDGEVNAYLPWGSLEYSAADRVSRFVAGTVSSPVHQLIGNVEQRCVVLRVLQQLLRILLCSEDQVFEAGVLGQILVDAAIVSVIADAEGLIPGNDLVVLGAVQNGTAVEALLDVQVAHHEEPDLYLVVVPSTMDLDFEVALGVILHEVLGISRIDFGRHHQRRGAQDTVLLEVVGEKVRAIVLREDRLVVDVQVYQGLEINHLLRQLLRGSPDETLAERIGLPLQFFLEKDDMLEGAVHVELVGPVVSVIGILFLGALHSGVALRLEASVRHNRLVVLVELEAANDAEQVVVALLALEEHGGNHLALLLGAANVVALVGKGAASSGEVRFGAHAQVYHVVVGLLLDGILCIVVLGWEFSLAEAHLIADARLQRLGVVVAALEVQELVEYL